MKPFFPRCPRSMFRGSRHFLLVLLMWAPLAAGAASPVQQVLAMSDASLLVVEDGEPVIAHGADRPMMPASTMKLLTSLAAIEHWGLDHRFHTDFFRDDDGWLWVKGYGDPFLVSEELERIAAALKARGLTKLRGIVTDDSYFAPEVEVAGRSNSDNPYDAPVAPLAANFNTMNVRVARGTVSSAEPQTPLTPVARELARGLSPGEHRINLGRRELAPRYFAELLAAKLRAAGVEVGAAWREAPVPAGLARFHRHENSRDLRAMLAAMLEYSNNFIANHLFLLLGDRGTGAPLTMRAAQDVMHRWIDKRFGWKGARVEDGAGLSRGNRLSARQLVDVVKAFMPYRQLLPAQGESVRAKTGTLTGVSCYAGFVERHGRWQPFALMINQPVAYRLREQLAQALAEEKDLAGYCRGGC